MRILNKWTRNIHRWLGLPMMLAVIVLIVTSIREGAAFQLPGWLGVVAIGSLVGLLLTGVYMFGQHYWARWRRARRSSRTAAG